MLSWNGSVVTTQVWTSAAANTSSVAPPFATVLATWVSDNKYIMWKDIAAGTANATDFSALTQGNVNGYDANNSTATMLTIISSILQIAVIVLSFGPFGKWFQHQKDAADADALDETLVAEPADVYDAYGCNAYGLDVDGNECPAPAY